MIVYKVPLTSTTYMYMLSDNLIEILVRPFPDNLGQALCVPSEDFATQQGWPYM